MTTTIRPPTRRALSPSDWDIIGGIADGIITPALHHDTIERACRKLLEAVDIPERINDRLADLRGGLPGSVVDIGCDGWADVWENPVPHVEVHSSAPLTADDRCSIETLLEEAHDGDVNVAFTNSADD